MKKRVRATSLFIALVLTLCIGITGCGESVSSGAAVVSGKLLASDLSIDDFDWAVEQIVYEGERGYAFSLTNNSEYDLLGVEIAYELKADVTEEQLKLFDSFKNEHADYIEEDDNLMLRGYREKYVPAKGGLIEYVGIAIGSGNLTWTDIPSEEQFMTMEPDYLSLAVIKGNNAYLATYDFVNEKWTVANSRAVNNWSDIAGIDIIEKPECPVFVVENYENINSLSVDAYGVDKEYYKKYVEYFKTAGFTENPSEYDDWYLAKDKKGNEISVRYHDMTEDIVIIYDYVDEDDSTEE